jgi:hypothetical protein
VCEACYPRPTCMVCSIRLFRPLMEWLADDNGRTGYIQAQPASTYRSWFAFDTAGHAVGTLCVPRMCRSFASHEGGQSPLRGGAVEPRGGAVVSQGGVLTAAGFALGAGDRDGRPRSRRCERTPCGRNC